MPCGTIPRLAHKAHVQLVQELIFTQSMRQRGDTSWASDLNAFRMCQDSAALEISLAQI